MKIEYKFFSFLAAFARKFQRVASYHYLAAENDFYARKFSVELDKSLSPIPREFINSYSKRWKPLSKTIRTIHLENAYRFSGNYHLDIVPSNIYFSVIEPALNNRSFAVSYEDKARIDWINGSEHVPAIFIRNINGVYYGSNQEKNPRDQIDLHHLLKDELEVVVKKSIEAHGGKGVTFFTKGLDDNFRNGKGDLLSLDYLEKELKQDFIIQKYVEQHEYYKKLNPSSLNTFRVMTYRSVKDNQIHILCSFLRIGAPGSRIDNCAKGGVCLCLKQDGHFAEWGLKEGGVKINALNGFPPFAEMKQPYKIKEIWETAKKIAARHVYSRLIAFDMTVDKNGKVIHVETNTSDIGMEGIQYVIGPMFHRFTDEVIDYCKEKLKSTSFYQLHES
ncbi:MAG: hypothetical protein JEZ14_04815 [Marinilabiliaceae bacterium]|nr:hypothetical protein [Marinilabiliaceae bacterium]